MTKRLSIIFDVIPQCGVFADIGCDHGLIAQKMLNSNKCDRCVVSDISEKSLSKAKVLLKDYIEENRAKAIVSDGFKNITDNVDVALIAGLGGEEICKILSDAEVLPPVLILQPMKNCDKVRKTLISTGYGINRDFIFRDVKFYNLIVADKNSSADYTEAEFEFGRENLDMRGEDFLDYLKMEIRLLEKYRKNVVSFSDLAEINSRIALLKEVLNNEYI